MEVKESVVTVGTFDGVHRGHREVLADVSRLAAEEGLNPVVVTFDRHPLEIVAPERAPKLIMSATERDALLAQSGVEVVSVPFTEEVRRLTAAEWMRVLRDRYAMRVLVLGYDNTFGSDGLTMSLDDYRSIGDSMGVRVEMAPMVKGCSSSAVRKALMEGDVEGAAAILGRPFAIEASVVHGRELGRTIGIPTANLGMPARQLTPKAGVYAAAVTLPDGTERKGVVNVGDNPTVSGDGQTRVEVHILDFDGDLYGQQLRVEFIARIRDERKFDSLADLQTQIRQDISTLPHV